MSKLLYGSELADYIKERQARQVRGLRQAGHIIPRLAIIKSTSASPVIDIYVRMKQRYGSDILVETVVETCDEAAMPEMIRKHNDDPATHGIIVQLPLKDTSLTDEIVNVVAPEKDVDGLGTNAAFNSATAEAVDWLLAGYGIELAGKHLAVVGNGRLVGGPLSRAWQSAGYSVTVLDDTSGDITPTLKQSDVIVSATGVPRLITSDMLPIGVIVVDAGTASENGVVVGDIAPEVYTERDDVIITPNKGGVGPLTIVALFEHVITAARQATESASQSIS